LKENFNEPFDELEDEDLIDDLKKKTL
jgi:hypothetical protein